LADSVIICIFTPDFAELYSNGKTTAFGNDTQRTAGGDKGPGNAGLYS
jgi:hypothetical protein